MQVDKADDADELDYEEGDEDLYAATKRDKMKGNAASKQVLPNFLGLPSDKHRRTRHFLFHCDSQNRLEVSAAPFLRWQLS